MDTIPPPPEAPRLVGSWRLGELIGHGSFAVVYLATNGDGVVAALKEVDTRRASKTAKLKQALENEVSALRALASSLHVVTLLDVVELPGRLCLVLEHCAAGDLAAWLAQRRGPCGEAAAHHFIGQLARGLAALRELHIIHRDLKPSNLLLCPAPGALPSLKIGDLGFARALDPGASLAETQCGSPLYMAPEVLAGKRYDAVADLWSVGVIAFEILCGTTPFGGASAVAMLRAIEASHDAPPLPRGTRASPAIRDLLRLLLRADPARRCSFRRFFEHSFFLARAPENTDDEYVLVARPPPAPSAQPSPALSAGALAVARSRSAAVLLAAAEAARSSDALAAVALHLLASACQPSPETASRGAAAVDAARAAGLAGHAQLPCPWRCAHAAAGAFARTAGASELRGAASEAASGYDKALTLVGLLLAGPGAVEQWWPGNVSLGPPARQRLIAAAAALRARVEASAAAAEQEQAPPVWWPPELG